MNTDTSKINAIEEKLPIPQMIPLGFQHILAMYAGAVVVPLMIGAAIGMTPKQITYLISADLLTSGIATLIQAFGLGKNFGIKLPVILGCSFTAVAPMIMIAKTNGIGAMYGSIMVSGLVVLILANFFGKISKLVPPVVTGSVVTIIGLSLIPVAINNVAGGVGAKDFGSPKNLALAGFVFLLIILINKFLKGFWQAISVLIGLIVGTVAAYFLGIVNLSSIGQASWVTLVTPFYFGPPKFVLSGILTMSLVGLVSMVESTGVFYGLGEVCGKKISTKDVVKGLRAEGLGQIFAGTFNSFPKTTFSQNVGLVALTGVRSRFVVVTAGIILIILSAIPKFAALATIIPSTVLGGAMIVMFGSVVSAGIKMLGSVDFSDTNNLLIVGCSVAVGLGATVTPQLFAQMPELFGILFGSGIVSGSVVAILLNLVLNWSKLKGESETDSSDDDIQIEEIS